MKEISKDTLLWVYSLAAPLLIACLYKVPIDFVTSFAWIAAFIYIFYSFITLILSLIRHFTKKSLDKIKLPNIIRPILCLVAFLFARELVFLSKVSANEKALNLALEMKQYVLKNGHCEAAGAEWKTHSLLYPNRSSIQYGEYGTKYFISYQCEPKKKEFSYSVRMDKDSDFRINHSENGKLEVTFGHYLNIKTITIDQNTSLSILARMETIDKDNT